MAHRRRIRLEANVEALGVPRPPVPPEQEVPVEPEAEKPRTGKGSPRIKVSRIEGSESSQFPVVAANGIQALVDSPQQLQMVLDSIECVEEMHSLHEQVAAWQDVQKRMAAANEQIVKIATVRLRLERKIGQHLAQTVYQGRPRKRSDRLTFSASARLPDGINKQRASWYRSIALVPEEMFEAFLTDRANKGKPPSATALLKILPGREARTRTAKRTDDPQLFEAVLVVEPTEKVRLAATMATPAIILDIVARVFGEVDVLVGDGDVPCARKCKASVLRPNDLRGCVVVLDCPDPATWLPKLAALRRSATIEQVAVVLAAENSAAWFIQAALDEWVFGFVPGGETIPMIAFQGRCEGFRAALGLVGGVALYS